MNLTTPERRAMAAVPTGRTADGIVQLMLMDVASGQTKWFAMGQRRQYARTVKAFEGTGLGRLRRGKTRGIGCG